MNKKAVLLINLGTPDDCRPQAVRRYLREFLNDPRVIDLPTAIRIPLVNALIVPFRFKKSAAAYAKIWGPDGSPLLTNTEKMQAALAAVLGPDYQVELGMRYGKPSIFTALEKIRDASELLVFPLFPQYSSAATGSAIEKVLSYVMRRWNVPALHVVRDFYNHPGFIAAYADVIREHTANKKIDLLLFSYHGLPERHIAKSECQAVCDHINACPVIDDKNRFCYRAQCYATSELLAEKIGLSLEHYAVAFQSRLGRTPWIKPYTDQLLPELVQKGIKNIAVACPSFVADCLETLEEVDIRTREQWHAAGGQTFYFIPCLNFSPIWIKALAEIVTANF